MAIQETKIDNSISTSVLFPESCPYDVYRKDRTLDGGGVMLHVLIHKDISHMPITELENDLESIWVKVFANKTSHFVASWYRPPGGNLENLIRNLSRSKVSLKRLRIYSQNWSGDHLSSTISCLVRPHLGPPVRFSM